MRPPRRVMSLLLGTVDRRASGVQMWPDPASDSSDLQATDLKPALDRPLTAIHRGSAPTRSAQALGGVAQGSCGPLPSPAPTRRNVKMRRLSRRRERWWRSIAPVAGLTLLLSGLAAPAAQAADIQCGVDYSANDWGTGFTANI